MSATSFSFFWFGSYLSARSFFFCFRYILSSARTSILRRIIAARVQQRTTRKKNARLRAFLITPSIVIGSRRQIKRHSHMSIFLKKNTDTYICINIHFYKYTHIHFIPINTSKKLNAHIQFFLILCLQGGSFSNRGSMYF
jgi:hypothetical protein